MRKIKLQLQCRVPSWNFCNQDGYTDNGRPSKELCRFCRKDKTGYHCILHDCSLSADPHFVNKTDACIKATAGYAITVDELAPTIADPKSIITETIRLYTTTVNDLINQGFPRLMAENLAKQYLLKDR